MKHDVMLLESTVGAADVDRYQWILPSSNEARGFAARFIAEPKGAGMQILRKLAENVHSLVQLPIGFCFDTESLQYTYRLALVKLGFCVRTNQKAIQAAVARCYAGFLSPLDGITEFRDLLRRTVDKSSNAERYPLGTDPFQHVVLISWLFESWVEFFTTYQSAISRSDPHNSSAKFARD